MVVVDRCWSGLFSPWWWWVVGVGLLVHVGGGGLLLGWLVGPWWWWWGVEIRLLAMDVYGSGRS